MYYFSQREKIRNASPITLKRNKKRRSADMKELGSNLQYPSLNEVNYLAFDESDEEYHNELYGFIESENKLNEFKKDKPTVKYKRIKNGKEIKKNVVISEFIRHQIHYPENELNDKFTFQQLQESIKLMRDFNNENMM